MAYTAFYITMKITKQEKILLVTAIYGVLGLGFGISGKIVICQARVLVLVKVK